jgi:hypothetical protein
VSPSCIVYIYIYIYIYIYGRIILKWSLKDGVCECIINCTRSESPGVGFCKDSKENSGSLSVGDSFTN